MRALTGGSVASAMRRTNKKHPPGACPAAHLTRDSFLLGFRERYLFFSCSFAGSGCAEKWGSPCLGIEDEEGNPPNPGGYDPTGGAGAPGYLITGPFQ